MQLVTRFRSLLHDRLYTISDQVGSMKHVEKVLASWKLVSYEGFIDYIGGGKHGDRTTQHIVIVNRKEKLVLK